MIESEIKICTGGFDLACSLQDFVQRVRHHVTCRSCLCFRIFTFRQFVFTSCMAPPACVCGADLSCLESRPPTYEFLANHGRITRLSVNLVQTVYKPAYKPLKSVGFSYKPYKP